jgi:hypothetical protein
MWKLSPSDSDGASSSNSSSSDGMGGQPQPEEVADILAAAPTTMPKLWVLPPDSCSSGSDSNDDDGEGDGTLQHEPPSARARSRSRCRSGVVASDTAPPEAQSSRVRSRSRSRSAAVASEGAGGCLSEGEEALVRMSRSRFVRSTGGDFQHAPELEWVPTPGCEWWQRPLRTALSGQRRSLGVQTRPIRVASLMTGMGSEFYCFEARLAHTTRLSLHFEDKSDLRGPPVRSHIRPAKCSLELPLAVVLGAHGFRKHRWHVGETCL